MFSPVKQAAVFSGDSQSVGAGFAIGSDALMPSETALKKTH